jgi:hypothetical protein
MNLTALDYRLETVVANDLASGLAACGALQSTERDES